MKSYKYLSLDLHKLIRIDGEYDRDGSITKDIDPRAIFSSQNNTRAEMIGSRVHLVKPGKVRIDIECYGDDDWRPADGITIILNITLPIVKHVKKDENRQYKVYLQNPRNSDTYLVSNLITNDIGEYSLTVDDFISFFSDNSSDSDISKIKKSSTDFGLEDRDISFGRMILLIMKKNINI